MPCKKEDRDLIDHLLGVEALSGFGICLGHDLGGKIIGRGARLDLRDARAGKIGDQRPDPRRTGPRVAAKQARHPARQRQKRPEVQDRLAALVIAKLVENREKRRKSQDTNENFKKHGKSQILEELRESSGEAVHAFFKESELSDKPHLNRSYEKLCQKIDQRAKLHR